VKVCPKDSSHRIFTTSAVEHHDWLVDGNGQFVGDLGCYESGIQEDELVCRTCSTVAEEIH
jgi:hypothetical protein